MPPYIRDTTPQSFTPIPRLDLEPRSQAENVATRAAEQQKVATRAAERDRRTLRTDVGIRPNSVAVLQISVPTCLPSLMT